MFKNKDGQTKFSFSRFISNASPVIAGKPQDTELSNGEQDAVFTYQVSEADPRILAPHAFRHAGITPEPKTSTMVHNALLKNGVLEKDSPTVNTQHITRNFAHELAGITSHMQKKLINLLFFWEGELERWKELSAKQGKLREIIRAQEEQNGSSEIYEKQLHELDESVKLRPSLRLEQT